MEQQLCSNEDTLRPVGDYQLCARCGQWIGPGVDMHSQGVELKGLTIYVPVCDFCKAKIGEEHASSNRR